MLSFRTGNFVPQKSITKPIVQFFVLSVICVGCMSQPQVQTLTILYSFTGGTDGSSPQSGVTLDAAGNIYGTTPYGGNPGCDSGCGTVFKVDRNGNEGTLYSFLGGTDGANPFSQLVIGRSGNLFGTTNRGGDRCGETGCGTVFEIRPEGEEVNTYRFTFYDIHDGSHPWAGLLIGQGGIAYGTTFAGGASGEGAVYAISESKERVLHSFIGGSDGAFPYGPLIKDKAGSLYGMTSFGGDYCPEGPTSGCGVVFKIRPQGREEVLYRFPGGINGAVPLAMKP